MKQKEKQVLAHLKVWLLQGKKITQAQALKMFRTSRLAVYIHRLRRRYRMDIKTEIRHKGDDVFAEYSLVIPVKKQKLF
jgi:hypothetical protein